MQNWKSTAAAAAATAILAVAGTPAQAASLAGDTISINLSTSAGGDHGTNVVLVGAGEEASWFGNQFVDANASVNGDVFSIRSSGNYCGMWTCDTSQTVTWTLSSLDFGVPLTGFTILQSIGPVTINSLTATSVQFTYNEASIPDGVYFQARFETGENTGVPEPSTWALMIAGFGLAGASIRARRTAAAAA